MAPTTSYIFWLILFSTTTGIATSLYFNFDTSTFWLQLFIVCGAICVFLAVYFKNGVILIIAICVLFFSIGSSRNHNNFIDNILSEKIGTQVELHGVIVDDPDTRDTSTKYRIWIDDLEENILITDYSTNKRAYGDLVHVKGKLQQPKKFITNTGRIFDYKNFLLKDKVRYFIRTRHIEHIQHNQGNFIKNFLTKIKIKFVTAINKIIPTPESSLLIGLLFGVQSSLGATLIEVFRASGLIHIIVLSGYNITLIIEMVRRMTSFLHRNTQIWICMLFIIMFVIMVGADIPVVRASLMSIVSLIALHFHREYIAFRTLGFIFVVLVLWNAPALFYDVSLHLSVLATSGIILLTPKIDNMLKKMAIKDRFGIRGILAATIGTQIFVVPYLAYAIGEVSIVSLVANIVTIPLVPFAMLFGFITAVFSFIFTPFAYILSTLTYIILYAIINFATFFGNLDFATVYVPEISIIFLILCYIFLFSIGYKKQSL